MKRLPYNALALAIALLLSGATGVLAGEPEGGLPDAQWEDRIRGLVEQLGDDDYQQREAAERALLEEGDAILPILATLGTPTDAEIRMRLRSIRYQLEGFLADIDKWLAAMEEPHDEAKPALPAELKHAIEHYQPKSGDYLLAIIGRADNPLGRRAVNAFVQTWESLAPEQVKQYLQLALVPYAESRPQYPQGVDAQIAMGYRIRYGWGGWPSDDADVALRTVTTHYLDGRLHGPPYSYHGPGACTGWLPTKDLALGEHSVNLVTRYEFDLKGQTHTGQVQSQTYKFEMVAAGALNDLAAPNNTELDELVRSALQFLEVQAVHPGRPIRISREPGDLPDPWAPQITWRSGDGNSGSLHMPLWQLTEELPVDLCFDVELRMEETGEVFEANPLVVIKGTKTSGYFFPESSRDFGGGKTGLIPVRIVLKPSRATALTDIRVTQYYQGTITSEPLRAKVMRD